jgi:hypothetical protein
MRAFAVAVIVTGLALLGGGVHAQPASERTIQPPPAPGTPPRSGTYADPFASRPQFDLTLQPQRPVHKRKNKRR